MLYTTKNKISISSKVLPEVLMCSDDLDLACIYEKNLPAKVIAVTRFTNLHKTLSIVSPDITIICINDPQSNIPIIKELRKKFPSMVVITVGFDIDPGSLQELMGIGVSGHLDRTFSRPRDLGVMVDQIFS